MGKNERGEEGMMPKVDFEASGSGEERGDGNEVRVRFLTGEEVTRLSAGSTVNEVKVAVANLRDKFAPAVKLVSSLSGQELTDDGSEAPTEVHVVIYEREYDEELWIEAMRQHGRVQDVEGVMRAMRAMDECVDYECGTRCVNEALLREVKEWSDEQEKERSICIHTFLLAGADINYYSDPAQAATCLMVASRMGRTRAVEVLLEARADVNAENRRGSTSLSLASATGRTDVVELLLEAGAVIDPVHRSRLDKAFLLPSPV